MGLILPFLVQGNIDDHTLAVTTETAKEAFAKAVEWQLFRFADVSISDGTKRYTVTEFASFMASLTPALTDGYATSPRSGVGQRAR